MAPRVLILRAPGTNCDQETAHAFQLVGGRAEVLHINRWLDTPQLADDYQVLCFPGGFSYGDDVAAGRILANQVRQFLRDAVSRFRDQNKLILGICNGFQALLKSGLLLPDRQDQPVATLTWNDSGRFEARWVHLRTASEHCVFLKGISRMYLPIAHAEGKFVAGDAELLERLDSQGCLALRYGRADGSSQPPLAFPDNPNGSQRDVAGICDETGRVLGLMPHPERHVDRTHNPHWTRQPEDASPDGLALFRNAIEYFA